MGILRHALAPVDDRRRGFTVVVAREPGDGRSWRATVSGERSSVTLNGITAIELAELLDTLLLDIDV